MYSLLPEFMNRILERHKLPVVQEEIDNLNSPVSFE